MKEVIKFRISLFRERFSIYGWSNVTVFTVLATLVIIGSKCLLHCAGEYKNISILISSFFCCFCSGSIFENKSTQKSLTIMLLFDKVDVRAYEKYLIYSRYVCFQLIYFYLLFPVGIENVGFFSFVFALVQAYLLITVLVHYYGSSTTFATFKGISSVVVCLLLIICYRRSVPFTEYVKVTGQASLLLFCLGLLMMVITVRKIDKIRSAQRRRGSTTMHKLKFIENNKDFLYILRTNILLEPMLIILISGVISYATKETIQDMLLTNILSYSYAYSEVYFELLKYENKCYTLIYSSNSGFQFKVEKIKNTVCIVLPVLLLVSLPLTFVTSFLAVFIAFIASLLLFVINACVYRTGVEKRKGYQSVLTEREKLCFLLIYSAEILLVCACKAVITM